MNSDQAKKLSIPDLMGMWGNEPVKVQKGGDRFWYKSPFRKEKDASFVTSYVHTPQGKHIWIWNDFGDRGGTIIDLVKRHESLDTSAALAYLERKFGRPSPSNRVGEDNNQPNLFSFKQQNSFAAPKSPFRPVREEQTQDLELKLLEVKSVTNPVIISYLTKGRGIDRNLINKYLVEISYENLTAKKRFFAFGIKNDSGGYEIRSASDKYIFKSSLNGKDITSIKGTGVSPNQVNIFEGMTDFLSLLTISKSDNLKGDAIIMNSTNANLENTLTAIRANKYDKINTFLDNNATGQKTTESIKAAFPNITTSESSFFAPHTDLNDMLKTIKGINSQRSK